MKRFVALVLALTLAATLVACSNGDNKNEQNPPAENTPAIKVDDATSSDVESATFDIRASSRKIRRGWAGFGRMDRAGRNTTRPVSI